MATASASGRRATRVRPVRERACTGARPVDDDAGSKVRLTKELLSHAPNEVRIVDELRLPGARRQPLGLPRLAARASSSHALMRWRNGVSPPPEVSGPRPWGTRSDTDAALGDLPYRVSRTRRRKFCRSARLFTSSTPGRRLGLRGRERMQEHESHLHPHSQRGPRWRAVHRGSGRFA